MSWSRSALPWRTVGVAALDLTDQATITPTLETLLKSHQPPQLLINNAGSAYTGDLVSMPLERWNWLIQLNLTSVLQVCSVVVPAMRAAGGLVINVSSHAANNAFPQWGAYCISKAALASFTRCLAEEERPQGIRACTLTWVPSIHHCGTRKPYKATSIVVPCSPSIRRRMHWCILLSNPPIR